MNQKVVSNEIICKQNPALKAALVYQLAEALGPVYSHNECFCTADLERQLVTEFQPSLPTPASSTLHTQQNVWSRTS